MFSKLIQYPKIKACPIKLSSALLGILVFFCSSQALFANEVLHFYSSSFISYDVYLNRNFMLSECSLNSEKEPLKMSAEFANQWNLTASKISIPVGNTNFESVVERKEFHESLNYEDCLSKYIKSLNEIYAYVEKYKFTILKHQTLDMSGQRVHVYYLFRTFEMPY